MRAWNKFEGVLRWLVKGNAGPLITVLLALVTAVAGTLLTALATEQQAQSNAVQAAKGVARSFLVIYEQMQNGLDSDIEYGQKIASPVSGAKWDLSLDDLEALGIVLKPRALFGVERAAQQLDSVFGKFSGEPNQSKKAILAFDRYAPDIQDADDDVRCAVIYVENQRRCPSTPKLGEWAESER